MTIFAAERERKAGRVGKPSRSAVHDFCNKRECLKSARAEFLEQQELSEVVKIALVSNSEHRSEALEVDIGSANIVPRRNREPVRLLQTGCRLLAHDVEYSRLRRFRLAIHEIHDFTLRLADNAGMRLSSEISNARGMPMIAASHAGLFIHSLLNNSPFSLRRQNESVEINLESVRNCIVVDAACEAGGPNKRFAVESLPIRNRS